MNICFEISDVDWALTKDIFGFIATVVSLVGVGVATYFGFRGLSVWRKQLRLGGVYETRGDSGLEAGVYQG